MQELQVPYVEVCMFLKAADCFGSASAPRRAVRFSDSSMVVKECNGFVVSNSWC